MTFDKSAYNKRYYATKTKYKHPQKWHISKRKRVKCPFCSCTHWYVPMRLYEPEVFGMLYGGRGCIEKYPESKLIADGVGSIVYGVKANYMRDLKDLAVKFLRLYCSEEEIKFLFKDLLVIVNSSVDVPVSFGYHAPSFNRTPSVAYSPSRAVNSSRAVVNPTTTVRSRLEGVIE